MTMSRVDKIVESIEKGGVALLPTDTLYGLAASPKYTEAVNKIYDLKHRPKNNFLPIMVANITDLEKLGLDLNSNAQKLINSDLIPGALSLILGFKNEKRPVWLTGRNEIAIRIPNDEELLQVLQKTGALLVTSANKHGNPNTQSSVKEILNELDGKPDIVIDKGIKNEIASTIINCRLNPPIIERQGFIKKGEIERFIDF